MSRAVFSGSLRIGSFSIPIGVYKSHDRLEIEAHRYHADCGSRIREMMYCEDHPTDLPVEFISAIEVNDSLLQVDSAVKSQIFDRDVPLQIISTHKVNLLRDAIFDGTIVPTCYYYVKPKFTDNTTRDVIGSIYCTFLHRLKVNNLFLFVSLPIDGMNRYAAITSGGVLIPFCYDSEIREPFEGSYKSDPAIKSDIDEALKNMQSDMFSARYSSSHFFKRIEEWMKKGIKKSVEKVSAKA